MQKGDKYKQSFIVSPVVYEGFIDIFKDQNPLHTDEVYARSKGFRDKVMNGNILNGFVSHFVGECLPVKNVIILVQSIQFALPVYLNDELEFNAEIEDYFESVRVYQFRFYFRNKDDKKVAKGSIQIGVIV